MRDVFVFGSNEAGRHGKGAALHAKKNFGAIQGQAFGRQGNSYAIPTKDKNLNPLSLKEIQVYVDIFLQYARLNYWESFNVTRIGCGLAGYKDEDIAPMFAQHSINVNLPQEWNAITSS